MRFVLLLALFGLIAPLGEAQEIDKEIVKQVRAALSAKRQEDMEAQLAKVYALGADAWPSVAKGLSEGPYYQKPLVTAFGERHSSTHFDIRFMGKDNKPRGFSMWVPKGYDAKTALPVLFYLHHGASSPKIQPSSEKAGVSLLRFKKEADERGFFVVAPYTSAGAEWWTPEGKRLVEWTLLQVRKRYKIDDDRIALVGGRDAGDSVWYLGQEMPGTWSALMPMSGDPYEITGLIRPLYLGTLDRMDVLIGIPARTKSTVGEKNIQQYLRALQPMFKKNMRVSTAVFPTSQGDFGYLEKIKPQIISYVMTKKRDAIPNEVDVESDTPLESLWLRNDGYDDKGVEFKGRFPFPSTHLKWTPPERKDPPKKVGLTLHKNPKWPVGLVIRKAEGSAAHAQLSAGDVLLEIGGKPVYAMKDVKGVVDMTNWGEMIKLVVAREFKESERNRALRSEKNYLEARIAMYERLKRPVPPSLRALAKSIKVVDEVAVDDDDDDDGCGDIEISDDTEVKEEKVVVGKEENTFFMVIHRWVRLMPPVPTFVRKDFGVVVDGKHGPDKGVKISWVYPNSLAARSGFKAGDIVQEVNGHSCKNPYLAGQFFRNFGFEKDPEGAVFSITRKEGESDVDRTIRVKWEHPKASRVDVQWNKKEKAFNVYTRKLSGFTMYFSEKLVKPGKEFSIYINGVPYQDLVDPATAPKYPRLTRGSDPAVADQLYRMRRKRAKVEGWTPDIKWAVQQYLKTRDRTLIFGAKRSFDLTKMAAGFEKAKSAHKKDDKKGEKVKKAYDDYKAGS